MTLESPLYYLTPDKRYGTPKQDTRDQSLIKETIGNGDFLQTLERVILPGYIEPKYGNGDEEYKIIPHVLEWILPLTLDNELTGDHFFITSSVAKAIIYALQEGDIPDRFYAHRWWLRKEVRDLKEQIDTNNPKSQKEAHNILKGSFAVQDPDVDLKVWIPEGADTRILSNYVYELINTNEPHRIVNEINKQTWATEDGNTQFKDQYLLQFNDDISILFTAKSIPTNYQLSLITIHIISENRRRKYPELPQEAASIYHIDIGIIDPSAPDKRGIETSSSQDIAVLPSKFIGDGQRRIKFIVPEESTDAMIYQDPIVIRSNNPKDLAEVVLRMFRGNSIFDRGFVYTPDGMILDDTNRIGVLAWKARAKELLDIRRRIINLAINGKLLTSDLDIRLIRDELVTLFTDDPFDGQDFLVDSGLVYLIPGLADKSMSFWGNVRKSKEFIIHPIKGLAYYNLEPWNEGDFLKNRRLYRSALDPRGYPYENGAKRFARAVDPSSLGREWTWFLIDIFEKLPREFGDENLLKASLVIREQALWPITTVQDSPQYKVARHMMIENKGIKSEEETEELKSLSNWFNGIVRLYALIQFFPSGILASELKMLDEKMMTQKTGQRFNNFEQRLLDLKKLGLLQRKDRTAYYPTGREILHFYGPRERNSFTPLSDFKENPQFLKTFIKVYEQETERFLLNNTEYKKILSFRFNQLMHAGVITFEELEALTIEDFKLFAKYKNIKLLRKYAEQLVKSMQLLSHNID